MWTGCGLSLEGVAPPGDGADAGLYDNTVEGGDSNNPIETGGADAAADGFSSDAATDGAIDSPSDLPGLSIDDVSVVEGNSMSKMAKFTLTLSSASLDPVTVEFATEDGTATVAGSDYMGTSGISTFPPGVLTQTVTVVVNGDPRNEHDEDFVVRLQNASGAVITDPRGQGTITNDDPVPTLDIDNVAIGEGNSGTSTAKFTVLLSAASELPVTVVYVTADGTATAGVDYIAATGTLTFAPGTLTQKIDVVINGDTTIEPNETFFVNLANQTNATVADAQGLGTITNDEGVATLRVDDVTVNELNAGTSTANFTVTLSGPSASPVTVAYATGNGTASAADYVGTSGTLTFAPGVVTQPVTVAVNGDTLFEQNETYFVNLTGPTGAVLLDGQGQGTITNDDVAPTLTVDDVTLVEGNTGTKAATFTITQSAVSGLATTVSVASANGSATVGGADYLSSSGTVTIPAGSTSAPFAVTVNGDTSYETDETFFINLNVPVNATITDSQGVGTITNDDAIPALTISDVVAAEGNGATTKVFTFTVTLSNPSSLPITVIASTADDVAIAGTDYVAKSSTLTFAAGVVSQPFAVTVNGDGLYEVNETFLVNLSGAVNATIGDNQALGTINNDDTAPTLAINDLSLAEGNSGNTTATFTVTLSAISGAVAMVQYATANGTATAGNDYTAGSGTLTFAAGVTSVPVVVQITGDTFYENNETYMVNLTGATGATIADPQGIGTITNDDPIPSLSIADVSHLEGNAAGITAYDFVVTLSAPSNLPVTVNFATADVSASSAVATLDYIGAIGTLTFAPGVVTQTITGIFVVGDIVTEMDETFFVNLTAPTNATLADGQAVGTIINDD